METNTPRSQNYTETVCECELQQQQQQQPPPATAAAAEPGPADKPTKYNGIRALHGVSMVTEGSAREPHTARLTAGPALGSPGLGAAGWEGGGR